MKKSLILSALLLIIGCEEADLINDQKPKIEVSVDQKSKLKEKFGFALMKSINESPKLRELIKSEALKMFNKDYEVLVYLIKDNALENGKTLEELINSNSDNNFKLDDLLKIDPTLTILVPDLPLDSFSARKWNTTTEIPAVAIRMNNTNEVPLITPENRLTSIPAGEIPGYPVLVIKDNERVVTNIESPNSSKLKTRVLYRKGGVEFKFWDNAFDNINKNINKRVDYIWNIDPKIIEAKSIYTTNDGWHRDFIYYDITPNSPNGEFKADFQEHIRGFSLDGDAQAIYNRISDQAGDPTYNNGHRINTSHWTGGYYEFKIKTLINSNNGLGNELINGFAVTPDELFNLEYETFTKGASFWKKTYYRLKNISLKQYSLDLPLISWDLSKYSTSLKISVEEVDVPVSTVITETSTVKFAANFEYTISAEIKKILKIGQKFGASYEKIQNNTIVKTFSEGNDFLGETIVNFEDDIIVGYKDYINVNTRDYSTGYCKFSVEPKRVQ